jgi:hypothetical protein
MDLLDVTVHGSKLIVSIERCVSDDPILWLRRAECCRMLARKLSSIGDARTARTRPAVEVALAGGGSAALDAVLHQIRLQLREIATRPCTPQVVVELLRIQPRERLRWTKDGRLRSSGSVSFRRGGALSCATYATEEVVRLYRRPEIIAAWRQADREAASRNAEVTAL